MDDILLIDKPKGITSFDVIRHLKRSYPKGTKLGHAGTLDPQATGLMLIGVGSGTKKLKECVGLNKVYEADVLLGVKTESGDLDGKIIAEKPVTNIAIERVTNALQELVGRCVLPVSKYSAMKVGGTPAYKLARQHKNVPNLKREMEIFWVKLHKHFQQGEHYVLVIELEVSSGTYIRSIAEEIGSRLNVPSALQNLRRTKVGLFTVDEAESL